MPTDSKRRGFVLFVLSSVSEEQDKNLEMLLSWVKQYPDRVDEFFLKSHQKLFNDFAGKKTEYLSNQR